MSITRDKSGLNIVNDIPDGEYSLESLSRRIETNFNAFNAANKSGQSRGFEESGCPDLGDACDREPKPSTVDGNSKADCYGEEKEY